MSKPACRCVICGGTCATACRCRRRILAHFRDPLIYLLLAEREIELVADRGLNTIVPASEWQAMVQRMGEAFTRGRFEDGLTQALGEVSTPLVAHFPADPVANPNDLPDTPVLG